MKRCTVCGRLSGTGDDHLDCIQMKKIELEDEGFRAGITERLDAGKDPESLGVEIKAVLEHLAREKESD